MHSGTSVEDLSHLSTRQTHPNGKKMNWRALGLLPPGLEPETFALQSTRYEVLVRRSNQLSYGSRPIRYLSGGESCLIEDVEV
jgi:hypothetical protein